MDGRIGEDRHRHIGIRGRGDPADLAEITDGFEEAGVHSQFNRQPSVEISIARVGGSRSWKSSWSRLTTFGGLTPIILETSRQAAYLVPMAIFLGFGILFHVHYSRDRAVSLSGAGGCAVDRR